MASPIDGPACTSVIVSSNILQTPEQTQALRLSILDFFSRPYGFIREYIKVNQMVIYYIIHVYLRPYVYSFCQISRPYVYSLPYVYSGCYQKNIGTQFTHLHIPSLCKEFFVMRQNIGHSSAEHVISCFLRFLHKLMISHISQLPTSFIIINAVRTLKAHPFLNFFR